LELETEELFLEVCETGFGRDLGIANSTGLVMSVFSKHDDATDTYRATSDLIGLAVVVLVVWRVSITVHGHDVWEHGTGAVVLVGIEEEAEPFELVCVAKDISWLRALLGEPHGKAVAVEVALTMDLELESDLLAREPLEVRHCRV
jgi:hypothetical protein